MTVRRHWQAVTLALIEVFPLDRPARRLSSTITRLIHRPSHLQSRSTVGFEADAESVEGIAVRNCDILYARGANMVGQHSAFSIICDGPAVIRGVTFEDIRVEENVAQMFELNVTSGAIYAKAPPGHIRNVRLKNIQWETAKPLLIRGHDKDHLVEDVVFEGCRVAGHPLSSAQIQANEFV
jgi:hypothetical protein